MRLVLLASLLVSLVVHYVVSPWSLLPSQSLELRDTEGELTIPIDLVENAAPAAPAPPPVPPATTPPPAATVPPGEGPKHAAPVDAGAPRARESPDAGPPRDAGVPSSPRDAGRAEVADLDASDRPELSDGGVEGLTAGDVLVEVRVNVDVVRGNPIGARLGPLLRAIPQWEEFMSGTDVDPLADTDWIRIYGPSLIRTEKDAVIVHYNMTDARAARDIAIVAKHDASGGAFDAGVPGVRSWRGHADKAWRIFLLPRPHVAMMVPPEKAHETARVFSRIEPRLNMDPAQAVWLMVKNPNHPMPFFPPSLRELRLWAVPRTDGGADGYAEADAPDEAAAADAARELRQVKARMNSFAVKLLTHGLLDDLEVTADGTKVKLHLVASREQLEALYDLIAAELGVSEPPSGSATPVTPAPPPSVPPSRR